MTHIIKEEDDFIYSIKSKEIKIENIISLNNKTAKKILKLLAETPMYPKEISKKLKLHEQNIYYHIRKLKENNLIKIEKSENINGTIANYYTISSDSFFIKLKNFKKTTKSIQKESTYLKPFITESRLNSLIIVGSPDPHGPQKARSRDGYFGMDLALFLGSFVSFVPDFKVRLDTEVTEKELTENNLILIGGPIVNRITNKINEYMPIYFDEKKKGIYSKLSKKTYFNDEIGIINKFKSPFNKDKSILLIAGIRNSGTKAGILSFLKHFDKLKNGNIYLPNIKSSVVEGIDLNSDGKIDDCEFLE